MSAKVLKLKNENGEELTVEPAGSADDGGQLYSVEIGGLLSLDELLAFARGIVDTYGHDWSAQRVEETLRSMRRRVPK